MAGISLLFLVSCQQGENVEPQRENTGNNFKKLGDERNPSEFMSQEELALVQNAFKAIEGKTLKNAVEKQLKTRAENEGGQAIEWDEGVWLLQESAIPVANVDGKYLYLKIMMYYYEKTNTFDTRVSYRLGDGATYKLGWKLDNCSQAYISGSKLMLFAPGCSFVVPLENNPQYTQATVAFRNPIQMAWDRGYDTCEVIINTLPGVTVTYK